MSDLDVIKELEKIIGVEFALIENEDDSKKYLLSYLCQPETEDVVYLEIKWINSVHSEDNTQNELTKTLYLDIFQAISKLDALKVFKFHQKNLGFIPDSISKLQNLSILDLSRNGLNTIPDCIFELSNLKELYLENNEITSIPDSFSKLNKRVVAKLEIS